jgi:glycosyltransferase involved in cell wall biosynthesis
MTNISIIIPYYKGKEYIYECFHAIENSYNKSNKILTLEIILVLDSFEEKDELKRVLPEKFKNLKIRIVSNNENIGVAKSRNKGLELAESEFVVFLDQDDLFLENYFQVVESIIKQNVDIFILNGYIRQIKTNDKQSIFHIRPSFTFKHLLKKWTNILSPGLLIFRKSILPKNLFLDTSEEYKGCDDWSAYLSLTSRGRLKSKFMNEKVFVYNIHESNYSHDQKHMRQAAIHALKHLRKDSEITKRSYQKLIVRHIKIRELKYRIQFEKSTIVKEFLKSPIIVFHLILNISFLFNKHISILKKK